MAEKWFARPELVCCPEQARSTPVKPKQVHETQLVASTWAQGRVEHLWGRRSAARVPDGKPTGDKEGSVWATRTVVLGWARGLGSKMPMLRRLCDGGHWPHWGYTARPPWSHVHSEHRAKQATGGCPHSHTSDPCARAWKQGPPFSCQHLCHPLLRILNPCSLESRNG